MPALRHEGHAEAGDVFRRFPDQRELSSMIAPVLGVSAPAMVIMVVDFPAPFGPTRVTISPSFTEKLIPRTAAIRP